MYNMKQFWNILFDYLIENQLGRYNNIIGGCCFHTLKFGQDLSCDWSRGACCWALMECSSLLEKTFLASSVVLSLFTC